MEAWIEKWGVWLGGALDREMGSMLGGGLDREKGGTWFGGGFGFFNFPPADKGNKFLSQTLIF